MRMRMSPVTVARRAFAPRPRHAARSPIVPTSSTGLPARARCTERTAGDAAAPPASSIVDVNEPSADSTRYSPSHVECSCSATEPDVASASTSPCASAASSMRTLPLIVVALTAPVAPRTSTSPLTAWARTALAAPCTAMLPLMASNSTGPTSPSLRMSPLTVAATSCWRRSARTANSTMQLLSRRFLKDRPAASSLLAPPGASGNTTRAVTLPASSLSTASFAPSTHAANSWSFSRGPELPAARRIVAVIATPFAAASRCTVTSPWIVATSSALASATVVRSVRATGVSSAAREAPLATGAAGRTGLAAGSWAVAMTPKHSDAKAAASGSACSATAGRWRGESDMMNSILCSSDPPSLMAQACAGGRTPGEDKDSATDSRQLP